MAKSGGNKRIEEIETDDLIEELKARGAWQELKDFDDDEIKAAFEDRGLKVSPDDDDPVEDPPSLNDAIDQARWGNYGLCGHYLIRAIPGLAPLAKILGA